MTVKDGGTDPQGDPQQGQHPGGAQDQHPGRTRMRRVYVWLGSVGGALVIAIATAFGSGIGQDLVSTAIGHHSPSGPPVRIDSVMQEETGNIDGDYVFAQKLVLTSRELRTFNQLGQGSAGPAAWLQSRGVVYPSGSSSVQVVIEGNRDHPVEITGARVVKQCQPPLNGTLFYNPAIPAGIAADIGMGFNMDSPISTAQFFNPDTGAAYGDFFAGHTISLAHGEVQTLALQYSTGNQYCQFTFTLIVVDGNTTTREIVTNHGQPFRVTALIDKGPRRGEFSSYKALYVISGTANSGYVRVDPTTYEVH